MTDRTSQTTAAAPSPPPDQRNPRGRAGRLAAVRSSMQMVKQESLSTLMGPGARAAAWVLRRPRGSAQMAAVAGRKARRRAAAPARGRSSQRHGGYLQGCSYVGGRVIAKGVRPWPRAASTRQGRAAARCATQSRCMRSGKRCGAQRALEQMERAPDTTSCPTLCLHTTQHRRQAKVKAGGREPEPQTCLDENELRQPAEQVPGACQQWLTPCVCVRVCLCVCLCVCGAETCLHKWASHRGSSMPAVMQICDLAPAASAQTRLLLAANTLCSGGPSARRTGAGARCRTTPTWPHRT